MPDRTHTAKGLLFDAILVRIRVCDSQQRDQRKLRPESLYLHGVELVRNYSLWPYNVSVSSESVNAKQLKFILDGARVPSWQYSAVLYPDAGDGERQAVVECGRRSATKASLVTTLSISPSDREALCVELRIA